METKINLSLKRIIHRSVHAFWCTVYPELHNIKVLARIPQAIESGIVVLPILSTSQIRQVKITYNSSPFGPYIILCGPHGILFAKKINTNTRNIKIVEGDVLYATVNADPLKQKPFSAHGIFSLFSKTRDTNLTIQSIHPGTITDSHDYHLHHGIFYIITHHKKESETIVYIEGYKKDQLVHMINVSQYIKPHDICLHQHNEEFERFGMSDLIHPNALTSIHDYLAISCKYTSQILVIDPCTETLKYRIGGKRSDFAFIGDPLHGFSCQHDPQFLNKGRNLLIYDNGNTHAPKQSRVVEYAIDFHKKTLTLLWSHKVSGIFTPGTGSVQRLSNGNTLICWGRPDPDVPRNPRLPKISEVTPHNVHVWDVFMPANCGTYRAKKHKLTQLGFTDKDRMK